MNGELNKIIEFYNVLATVKMNRFINFLEEKFVPLAAKIGGQKHLVAIRDSFAALMPLILVGAFAVLLNNTMYSLCLGLFSPTILVLKAHLSYGPMKIWLHCSLLWKAELSESSR